MATWVLDHLRKEVSWVSLRLVRMAPEHVRIEDMVKQPENGSVP